MSDYKVGDWLVDKRYNDVWEITYIFRTDPTPMAKITQKFDMINKTECGFIHNRTILFEDLDEGFTAAPLARLLYGKNGNKVVQDEKNEE